jgi:hypothetical protein
MTTPSSLSQMSSLLRPLVNQHDLDAAGLEVRLPGSPRVPSALLSRSPFVQKMAYRAPGGGAYVLRAESPQLAGFLTAFLSWPESPETFEAWWAACDFLMLSPHLHEISFAASRALHCLSFDGLIDCSSFESLLFGRRARKFNTLLDSFLGTRAVPMEDVGPYDQVESLNLIVFEEQRKNREPGGEPLLLDSIRSTTLPDHFQGVEVVYSKLLQVCQALEVESGVFSMPNTQVFCRTPTPLHAPVEMVTRTLVALTNTARGSRRVLGLVRSLHMAYGASIARQFVHRAFCCLYLAESLEEVGLGSVPLDLAHDLQTIYFERILDMACFIPAHDRLCFLLPGLLGSRETMPLRQTAEEIYEQATRLVPWLSEAMQGPVGLHLTGSLLCWCRGTYLEVGPSPGDVDLFCERPEELEEAARQVAEAMVSFAKKVCASASVEARRHNSGRFVLKMVEVPEPVQLPSYVRSCDVYVNTPLKVSKYHLPQVRASLRLEAGVPSLFLTASAAIAWITMLNVDYNSFRGRGGEKTPYQIVARSWLWGFNLLVSDAERASLEDYLRHVHPVEYNRAVMLSRPQRLREHTSCSMHLSSSFNL